LKLNTEECSRLKLENADWITLSHFVNHAKTIDVMNANITLLPVLERKLASKTENDGGISIVYRIKIPIYADFEGDSTMLVRFDVSSGFHALPFFFIYTIPWEPKHGWKAYNGHKTIEFIITSKGWQVVEGEERIGITYQRMW